MSQVSNTSFTTTLSLNATAVVDYLSKSMMSALPFIVCAALFRTVAVIMGEGMLGLWSADSEIYRLFYSWLYNAGYYFLPIYLGWAAARQLGCSEQLGMMLGGVLIAPDLLKLVDAASTTGASMTSVYGLLPAPVNDYTTTVIPVLISVPVLWRVECFFQRVIPKAVAFSFVPFATMLVMVPVSLCITAPAGSYLGMLLGQLMFMLGNSGGIVSLLTLMGLAAGWEFLKIAGVSNVVLSLAYAQFMSVGTDSCILIAATMATFAVWGMPFGASLRVADKDEKALMLGYSISGVLGGVSEPALYGCGFKYGRCLTCMAIGGAVGGLVAAVGHVTAYTIGMTNVLMVIGFATGGISNLLWCCAAGGVAFAVSAALSYCFGVVPTKGQAAEDGANSPETVASAAEVSA